MKKLNREQYTEKKTCTAECYDEGLQQVETLCDYCQSYRNSVEAEALREYKISPAYWAWHDKRHTFED